MIWRSATSGALWLSLALALAACDEDPDPRTQASDSANSSGSDAASADAAPDVGPDVDEGQPGFATRAMTFNVLCSACDLANHAQWAPRLEMFADIFERHQADLVGLQELIVADEVEQVMEGLPGYEAFFYRDTTGDWFDNPDSVVAWRVERFTKLDEGVFWLSPEPDEPFSGGFSPNTVAPRLAAWVLLEEAESGLTLTVLSTHFDNNPPGQAMSAPLVLERAEPWLAAGPVVLLGDFNADPGDEAYQTLVGRDPVAFDDTYVVAETREQVDATDGAVGEPFEEPKRIDHIFVSAPGTGGGAWRVPRWAVDVTDYDAEDGEGHRPPSDHRAIVSDLEFTASE